MKNFSLLLVFAFITSFALTSCGPDCKSCTAETVTITDLGGVMDTTTASIPASELCDEALTLAEGDPQTTSSSVGGATVTTTVTYTCD